MRRKAKGNLWKDRRAPWTDSWELKIQKVEYPESSSTLYRGGKSKRESSRLNPHKISLSQDLHYTVKRGGQGAVWSKCWGVLDAEASGACSFIGEKTPTLEEITYACGKYGCLKLKSHFSPRRERAGFRGAIVGMKGPDENIESWDMPEDIKYPEDRPVQMKTDRY